MAVRQPKLDQLYWLLVIKGPMTLTEIVEFTGWTYYQANQWLQQLKGSDSVELLEREQHRGAYNYQSHGHNRCGRWAAITDLEPDVITMKIAK